MKRLALAMTMGGASLACGFAGVGFALYAQTSNALPAAWLFAGFGLVAGLVCGGLHLVFDGIQVHERAALPAEALAAMVRAAVASAVAERAARPGSAADRRPTPAVPAAAPEPALSAAAVEPMTAASASPSKPVVAARPEFASSALDA
jgi:hypothetical protein